MLLYFLEMSLTVPQRVVSVKRDYLKLITFHLSLLLAVWAYSFNHEVGRFLFEALGEFDLRHIGIVEAVGLLALFAIEMGMLVVIVIVVVTMAEFIAYALTTTLNHMYQMMLLKEVQRPENIRLVDTQDLVFEFRQGNRMQGFHQFL